MNNLEENACACCYHDYRGPIHMVIPDGHIVQKCGRCEAMRTIHAEHRAREFHRGDYSSYFAPMGRYVKRGGYIA